MDENYPLTYSVDYPDRQLDRLSSALRIFWVIPIAIVLGTVAHVTWGGRGETLYIAAGGILFGGPLLMILFRKKYPRWWFDWNRELLRFGARVACVFRADERRVPVDRRAAVGAAGDRVPECRDGSRARHAAHQVAAGDPALHRAVLPGHRGFLRGDLRLVRDPVHGPVSARSIFDFVVGMQRWYLRVVAYMAILVTDKYPPFSLE